MKRVLVIDNSVDTTGANLALIKLALELRSQDISFVFVYPENSRCITPTEELGFKTFALKMIEISKRIGDNLLYFPLLIRNAILLRDIVKNEEIDVVHVNDLYNMLGLSLRLFTGIRVITHVRRMPESFPAKIYAFWSWLHVRFSDNIVAVSVANKNALPENNKTTVVYDPLPDREKYPRYLAKSQLGKRINVLILANYTPGKGHFYALEVLAMAVKDFPEWTFSFNFYGGDFGLEKNRRYKKELKEAASRFKIEHSAHFHDKMEDIESGMKMHDLVLNLSDSESFSRVTLEALYFGVPVIATNVGGTNEMVLDLLTGILVTAKDVGSIYNGFKKIIESDALRVSLSANSYSFVRESFSFDKTSSLMRDVYLNG